MLDEGTKGGHACSQSKHIDLRSRICGGLQNTFANLDGHLLPHSYSKDIGYRDQPDTCGGGRPTYPMLSQNPTTQSNTCEGDWVGSWKGDIQTGAAVSLSNMLDSSSCLESLSRSTRILSRLRHRREDAKRRSCWKTASRWPSR
jgi:hypothetical protein